jgi:hypothetical protein
MKDVPQLYHMAYGLSVTTNGDALQQVTAVINDTNPSAWAYVERIRIPQGPRSLADLGVMGLRRRSSGIDSDQVNGPSDRCPQQTEKNQTLGRVTITYLTYLKSWIFVTQARAWPVLWIPAGMTCRGPHDQRALVGLCKASKSKVRDLCGKLCRFHSEMVLSKDRDLRCF